MQRIVAAAVLGATLWVAGAAAQPTPPAGAGGAAPAAQSSHQDLLKSCNEQAAARKLAGNAQRGFLNTCLAAKSPTFATEPATPARPNPPSSAR